ncbi:DNA cytosine methyltransferase [Halobacillus trueperi]|uniref:DNA cytosine methyltransferase n=1 Tax=Halobacillus trueperi TaxID=156205 RepID=UPI003735A78E
MDENKLNIVELFSGPGGLGLGFHLQGFNTTVAYEYEDDCIDTYSANFPEAEVVKKDLSDFTKEDMTELRKTVRRKTGKEDVDIVVGGPPCRSFSSANPKKKKGDPRDVLYRPLIKVASELNAKYFVMENVADINNKTSGDVHEKKVFHIILEELLEEGFKYINCNLLNSADYGTPQTRERLIVIATKDENLPLTFPKPLYFPNQEPRWKTVEEAFQDLPRVSAPKDPSYGEQQEYTKKDGKMYICEDYGDSPQNDFTKFCRGELTKYGYVQKKLVKGTVNKLTNFIIPNHTERIIERYSLLQEDESQGLLRDRLDREMSEKDLQELIKRKVISAGTFRQKNRRLPLNRPSRTVTSHVREELVHPEFNRNLTAREAARLQGFPDWYVLKGINQKPYKGSSEDLGNGRDFYQQVGDAVPPLLASAIAYELKKNLMPGSQSAICKDERESLINWVIKEGITLQEIKRSEISPSVTIGAALSGTVNFDLEFMSPFTLV